MFVRHVPKTEKKKHISLLYFQRDLVQRPLASNKRKKNQVKGKGISKICYTTQRSKIIIFKRDWKVIEKTASGVFIRKKVGFCPFRGTQIGFLLLEQNMPL